MKILTFVADPAETVLRELSAHRWLFTAPSPTVTAASPTASAGSTAAVSPTGSASAPVVHRSPSRTREVRSGSVHRSGRTLKVVRIHIVESYFLRIHDHAVTLLLLVVHGWRSHHSRWDHGRALHSLIESTWHVRHGIHADVRHEHFAVARSPAAAAARWHLLRHRSHMCRSHHLLRHLWTHRTHC